MHELLGMIDRVLAVTASDPQVPIDTTPGYTPPLSMDDIERMHGENLTLIKNYVITLFRERFPDLQFAYLPSTPARGAFVLEVSHGGYRGNILVIQPGIATRQFIRHRVFLLYMDMDHVRAIATGRNIPLAHDRFVINIQGRNGSFWTDAVVSFFNNTHNQQHSLQFHTKEHVLTFIRFLLDLSKDDSVKTQRDNLQIIQGYVITWFRARFPDLRFVYRPLRNGVELRGTNGVHTGVILTIIPGPPTVLLHQDIRLYYTDMDHVRGIATGVRQPLEPDRRELIDIGGMYDNFWTDTVVTFYGPGVFHEREYASRDEAMQAVKDGLHIQE